VTLVPFARNTAIATAAMLPIHSTAILSRAFRDMSFTSRRLSRRSYDPKAPTNFSSEAVTMAEDADPVPGPQSSNEGRHAHLVATPHGGGWRMFQAPVEVEAYFAQVWVPVLVDGFDEETTEIWARWPPGGDADGDVHHEVIDASHYRPPKGGFPAA
jgi:hypothetical protein